MALIESQYCRGLVQLTSVVRRTRTPNGHRTSLFNGAKSMFFSLLLCVCIVLLVELLLIFSVGNCSFSQFFLIFIITFYFLFSFGTRTRNGRHSFVAFYSNERSAPWFIFNDRFDGRVVCCSYLPIFTTHFLLQRIQIKRWISSLWFLRFFCFSLFLHWFFIR